MLLVGHPCTERTLLVYATASEAIVPLVCLRLANLMAGLAGLATQEASQQGRRVIRQVFEQATKRAPSLLLLNDLDELERLEAKEARQAIKMANVANLNPGKAIAFVSKATEEEDTEPPPGEGAVASEADSASANGLSASDALPAERRARCAQPYESL